MSATSKNISGGSISYGGGVFRLKGTADFDGVGISFTAQCEITTKMNEAHNFVLEYKGDADSTWNKYATTTAHNKTFSFPAYSVNGTKLEIRLRGATSGSVSSSNYSSDTITFAVTQAPTYIDAIITNDNLARIIVKGDRNTARPIQSVTIERSNNPDSGYSSITDDPISASSPYFTYDGNQWVVALDDTDIEAGNRYYWRAKAYNSVTGDSAYKRTDAKYTSASSDAVTNVATNVSGNSVTVTWNCNTSAIQNGTVTGFIVEESVDDGTYSQVGTVSAVAGQGSYSFTKTISPGHTYKYQVRTSGSGGGSSGGSGGGSDIETAPAAPSDISVYRAEGSDNVVINVTGNSSNAESVVIDRCIDGGSWSEIATINYASTVTYTDTAATASDNIVYRAKYTNSKGSSGYVTSAAVPVKQKPQAPILKSPVSGSPIDMAAETVRLVWQHRPLDGSPQLAATLQYKVGSGSWVTVSLTTATYYDLSFTGMSANDVITWKVSTKGSHADYSDYSDESTFRLLTKPTLAFTEPDNADVIEELPVVMEFSYNDACGTLEELKVDIIKKNEVVKTVNVDVGAGTSGTYTHSLAGYLFENETVYGLKAYARSSSGLSAEDSISISINYTPVSLSGGLIPSIVADPDTGYAYITCMRDITPQAGGTVPTPVAISEAYLYRVYNGETTLVGAVSEGMQVLDKYAPVNVDCTYRLLLLTAGGAVSIVDVTFKNTSPYWFCYFGDEIAKAKWNPEGSVKLSRPQRTEVRYSGRRYPVSYDQDAVEETFDFTTVFTEREDLNQFRRLMRQGGTGIWKSGDGDVYDADFEFSYSSDYKLTTQIWNASLSVTRIDGGDD